MLIRSYIIPYIAISYCPLMMSVVLVLVCQMLVLTAAQERLTPDVCHEGFFTKDAPSAEAEPLGACESWQGLSCCTAETAASISRYQAMQLYNFTWDLGGDISSECQTYLTVRKLCNQLKMQL